MKFNRVNDVEFLKEEVELDEEERKNRRAKCYRKYALLEEGVDPDMDHLDNWALNAAGCDCCCSVEDIKEALNRGKKPLTEKVSTTVKQIADEIDADEIIEPSDDKDEVFQILDDALEEAMFLKGKRGRTYPNVLIVSEAGLGKTARVNQWAKSRGVHLVGKQTASLDSTDLGGLFVPPEKDATTAKKVATGELNELYCDNSVLFLDEYNRGRSEVRAPLLELINSHTIPDPNSNGGVAFIPTMLFTIATINPSDGGYNVQELDRAELSRFGIYNLAPDPRSFRKYILSELESDRKEALQAGNTKKAKQREGAIHIATKLLNDKRFSFDDTADIEAMEDKFGKRFPELNYRSLTSLLQRCDGTKKDFLDKWTTFINPLKKNLADTILKDYRDIEDKANEVLQDETESEIFKKPDDPWTQVLNYINNN